MKAEKELPVGFSNALKQNHKAADFFQNCTDEQKAAIISQVHSIHSKEEMKSFVEHLPSAAL